MKVGIVTYHRSHNYGAFLQSYAMAKEMENRGHNVEIIDVSSQKAKSVYFRHIFSSGINEIYDGICRYKMFEGASEMLPLSKPSVYTDDLSVFSKYVENRYDLIVSGSDEVWRIGVRGFPNQYWLPGDLGCRKMAYAVSSRQDVLSFPEEQQEKMRELIKAFEYVGVRDQTTFSNVQKILPDVKIYKNCDPVFIHDFENNPEKGQWLLQKKYGISSSKKTIAVMLENKELSNKVVSFLRKTYGNSFNYIALYYNHSKLLYYRDCSPFEWISAIANVDFFISSFFHGTAFAIKGNTPFITIECRDGEATTGKNYDLLSEMDMLDRLVHKSDKDLFSFIQNRIDIDIDKSFDFSQGCFLQKKKSESFFRRI